MDLASRYPIAHLPVAAYVCDAAGAIRSHNAHATRLWGSEPAAGASERSVWEGLARTDGDGLPLRADDSAMMGALSGVAGPHARLERFTRPDGSVATILASAETLRSADGAVVGAIATLVELSSPFPSLQAELARKARELERSNAELEQFAYVASHDLQEPLRMVRGYLTMLRKRHASGIDAKGQEFLGFALDGAERMQQLIKDVLSYSRVSDSTAQLVIVPAHDAVAEATANLHAKIEENAAVVTEGPLPEVMFDRLHLVQVFQNLISNAITYRRLEQPPSVAISALAHASEWEFVVADNGIGIAPEHQEHVFKIFRRLHTRAEYPGSGIGLAICKKSIERWGGRIWVESKPGEGSAFHFTIPRHDV